MNRLRPWLWLPSAMLATTAVAVLALTGFDGLYGQDSFAYFRYATGPLRQTLLPLPAFFWPPGYPLLVALASTIMGRVPLTGQIVSILAGAAVPAFTMLLAGELVRPTDVTQNPIVRPWRSVPMVAGLIVAVTGQLLQSSIVVMADTLGLAAATGGAWAVARYNRSLKVGWLMLAAAAFAWAISTRWIYALVAIPFLLWSLHGCRRSARRAALLHLAAGAVVAGAILAPTLVPATVGLVAGTNPPFAGDLQVYSWSLFNATRSAFTTGDGLLSYRLPNGLYYGILPGFWWYFGPVLAVLILPGAWTVLRRRTRPRLFIPLAWAGIVYAFHAGAPWQNPRFALAYLPPLAILAALGFGLLRDSARQPIRAAGTTVLVAGLALAAAGSALLTDRFIARQQEDTATVHWTERLAPSRSQLLTFGLTATFQQDSPVPTFDLSEVDSSQIARLLSDGHPTVVLVDATNLERQWKGMPVWRNYLALLNGPGLTRLGGRDQYTLFVVDQGPS